MYSEKIMDHFKHPRNQGKIKNADGVGKLGNPVCGDVMYLYIKVSKNKKGESIIKDIKWETYGCVAAIANTSILSEKVKGMTLKQAENLTKKDVLGWIGEVPKQKVHCSILADDCLKAAIKDYKNKKEAKAK